MINPDAINADPSHLDCLESNSRVVEKVSRSGTDGASSSCKTLLPPPTPSLLRKPRPSCPRCTTPSILTDTSTSFSPLVFSIISFAYRPIRSFVVSIQDLYAVLAVFILYAFLSVVDVGSSSINTRCNDEEGADVGDDVGDRVSPEAMGDCDVGAIVGTEEGVSVGLMDGRFDGETVGEVESVGDALGQTKGVGLGDIVGKAVGFWEG